jgi:hypothetical protein
VVELSPSDCRGEAGVALPFKRLQASLDLTGTCRRCCWLLGEGPPSECQVPEHLGLWCLSRSQASSLKDTPEAGNCRIHIGKGRQGPGGQQEWERERCLSLPTPHLEAPQRWSRISRFRPDLPPRGETSHAQSRMDSACHVMVTLAVTMVIRSINTS